MIWFLDFERRFSSLFELEESRNSQGGQSNQKQQQYGQFGNTQVNQSAAYNSKKNSFAPSIASNQQEGYQLEHIDFQELYDDIEYKQLSKQSIKIQFDALTVSKYPIFCFFARILQIMQQSIDESRHLKNWGIFNNILDYINIERSVLAGLLIVMKSSGERVSFYHALYRFHRILLGMKDMRKRVLVDIDAKNQQYRIYNQNISAALNKNANNSNNNNINVKKLSPAKNSNSSTYQFPSPHQINSKIAPPSNFNFNQSGRGQERQEKYDYVVEGEVRINMQNDQQSKQNDDNNINKKKSSVVYDVNYSFNGQSSERKRSSAINSLTSSPNSPISPIFSESEREFLMVTYEIFFYTHKYSQQYLFDNIKDDEEGNLNKLKRDSSGEGKNVSRSSLSSGSNQSGNSPTDSDIMEEETERNKLKQIFELAASYLLEQQQQYLAPRQKISSLDLDYNVNQTLATFTQKLSDGFKSTCSYSSGSVSLSHPIQSHQFSVNITSAKNGYSINEISLNNYFDSNYANNSSIKNNNFMSTSSYFGFQDELSNNQNSYSSESNLQQDDKHNQSLGINDSMLASSLHPFNQMNTNKQLQNKNFQNLQRNRERELSDVGSNYLKSLKQVCKEQDDQVNNYLKMLLHRQKKNMVKQDVTPRNIPKLQVSSAKIYASSKSFNFSEVAQEFQSESDQNDEQIQKKDQSQNSFSSFYKQREKEQMNLNRLSSRSSSCGSNNVNEFGQQYDSNTSINEQDFEEEEEDQDNQRNQQSEIHPSEEQENNSSFQNNNNSTTTYNQMTHHSNKHFHHHHHHSHNHHHHHHHNSLSKSIKQKKFNPNADWTGNLQSSQPRKKSQSYMVSLMQEVKEEKEDSDLFNSILLDRSRQRSTLSPSKQNASDAHKSIDKDKLGFFNNSSEMQMSIALQRQSVSSSKSVVKSEFKMCASSVDSGPNINQNARSSSSPQFAPQKQSPKNFSAHNLDQNASPPKLFTRIENNEEPAKIENPIQFKKVNSNSSLEESDQNQNKQRSKTEIKEEKIQKQKKEDLQKESSDDESNTSSQSSSCTSSSSSSSSSSCSSPSSSTQSKNNSNKKQSGRQFKIQRIKSQTTAKRNHNDKITENLIQLQNQITKQTRHSRMKQKKSHKKRKKSQTSRKLSNSASKSSSQANRTFDTENSSSAHSSAIRAKKLSELEQSSHQIDISLLNVKNPLQRRGGIQVRTVQKHLTKSGKEFDTLGVVKPNFSLINEINIDSSEFTENRNVRKSFEDNTQQTPNLSYVGQQSLNSNRIPSNTQIKSPQISSFNQNFSFLQNSGLENKQTNQSADKKNLRRQTSQDSVSSGSEIKPKKRNSFFQKILNFFHKQDSREDTNNQRHQSFSPQLTNETPTDSTQGYIPPNMDPTVDKYLKRGFQINGATFYKIKDVLSFEQKKGKINSRQQSYFNLDSSYANTTRAGGQTFKTPTKTGQQMNNSIYFSSPEQHLIMQSTTKAKTQFLAPNCFSDHFNLNASQTEVVSQKQLHDQSEQDEQFERELQELFEKSSNQTDYDLQDRKNNLINLYGKSSNIRQVAKKSSLNYKELSIIVDEEMNNENSLANRLAQNRLKRGYNVKDDLIQREINEEQFFTFPRESVNYITYQKEQFRKSQQIRIQAQKHSYEFQIVSNQKSNWVKLRIQVRKVIFFYKIYLEKKQFYPKKKALKDFFNQQQLIQYSSQIIKDIERQQLALQSTQSNQLSEDNSFNPSLYIQQSRQKVIKRANDIKNINDNTFENLF